MSRRLGKTYSVLHLLATAMMTKVGSYLLVLPYQVQARAIVWKGLTNDGTPMLDATFPAEIVSSKNNTEMTLTLINGSILKVAGADNVDSLVGTNHIAIVFDEAALIKQDVLAYLLPIVEANDGWILFSSTPRYGSWFTKLYEDESGQPDSPYTIHTCNIYESNTMTNEQIDSIRIEYIKRYGDDDGSAYFNTEYLLDITASNAGSFYGGILSRLEDNIQSIEIVQTDKVYAAYDLGMNDQTVITIFKKNEAANLVEILHVIEGSGRTIQDYYLKDIKKLPYKVHTHYLPHDGAQVRGYSTKVTAQDALKSLGARTKVIPRTKSVIDDINFIRETLPQVIFNNTPSVLKMRNKLRAYSKIIKEGVVTGHQHCDHSDSFRYAIISAINYCKETVSVEQEEATGGTSWME